MRALLFFALMMPSIALAADGATLYKRCAACHLPTGKGMPGAFPPLGADFKALAMKPDGRRYIILTVLRGVSGPIIVEGKPYRGVMPAQAGMTDEGVAAVLNHIAVTLANAGKAFKPFTPAEVMAVRAGASALMPSQIGQMHAKAGGK